MKMWAAPPPTVFVPFKLSPKTKSSNCRGRAFGFNVRAQLSDYPLASKLMVRNLPYSVETNTLQKQFSSFGQIAEVNLVKDAVTNTSKGYAFIQYTSQDDAMLALENMDKRVFEGRLIHVEIAKPGRKVRELPRTTGPPKRKPHLGQVDEIADCWY